MGGHTYASPVGKGDIQSDRAQPRWQVQGPGGEVDSIGIERLERL